MDLIDVLNKRLKIRDLLVQLANHASTRTTQLYDRRQDDISLDEVERIRL